MSSRRRVDTAAGESKPAETIPAERPILGRDEIFSASDLRIEKVYVPEWSGDVYVRGMTGAERDQYEALIWIGGRFSNKDMHAKLLTFTVCDEAGNLVFHPGDEEEVKKLTSKSAASLHRLYIIAQRLSGMHLEIDMVTHILKNARPASSPTA